MNNRFFDQQLRTLKWAVQKGLCNHDCVPTQMLKTQEEMGELIGAYLKQQGQAKIQAEFGDVLFCLTVLADQLGLDFTQCLKTAVDKNEHRTGQMINNVFVRDQ